MTHSESWVNLYRPTPVQLPDDLYGPDPYDINFSYPLHLPSLENELVQLTPLIPRVHCHAFWEQVEPALGDLLRYLPWPITSYETMLTKFEQMRADPSWVVFVVVDKTKPPELDLCGALAGTIGFLKAEPANRAVEIGAVITLPRAQRTFVTSNAVGLLLQYCFQLPTATPPGLGLRRVVWRANVQNARSIALAKRMGFKQEGLLRWAVVLPEGKEGNAPRPEDPVQLPGRESMILSICWDEWEAGDREYVLEQMRPR
jgi:RimJ/RimL family protein N-acetyltransferase